MSEKDITKTFTRNQTLTFLKKRSYNRQNRALQKMFEVVFKS